MKKAVTLPRNFKQGIANKREISSVGSEHLPYKQRVNGSSPLSPTNTRVYVEKHKPFFAFNKYILLDQFLFLDDISYHKR